MTSLPLGVNLSFAVKRWPEPEVWAAFVREELGVELVQFSFDLLDPWWPEELSRPLARRVRDAAKAEGLTLHSAFVGLAAYTYNGLLHPEAEGRRAAYMGGLNAPPTSPPRWARRRSVGRSVASACGRPRSLCAGEESGTTSLITLR